MGDKIVLKISICTCAIIYRLKHKISYFFPTIEKKMGYIYSGTFFVRTLFDLFDGIPDKHIKGYQLKLSESVIRLQREFLRIEISRQFFLERVFLII